MSHFSRQDVFIINDLGTEMSPYAKPGVQEFKFGRYSTDDERLRHFTTTRSKRSVYRYNAHN